MVEHKDCIYLELDEGDKWDIFCWNDPKRFIMAASVYGSAPFTLDFKLQTYHLGKLWKSYAIRFKHTTYNGKTKRNSLEYLGKGDFVWPLHTVEFYYEDITQDIIDMVVEQLLAKQAEMTAEDMTHEG